MTTKAPAGGVRASAVSRQVNAAMRGHWESPIVEQMGEDSVLVEGATPATLGFAADALARLGRYRITWGGQWVEDGAGRVEWLPWVEVRRA